jgi:hypothetical protein
MTTMDKSPRSHGDDAGPKRRLAELQAPDELSLIFNPIGLGPPISPENAAEHQAQMIERAILVEKVPLPVRENFERARKLHMYGILEYEFFTAAGDYAVLVSSRPRMVRKGSRVRVSFRAFWQRGQPSR